MLGQCWLFERNQHKPPEMFGPVRHPNESTSTKLRNRPLHVFPLFEKFVNFTKIVGNCQNVILKLDVVLRWNVKMSSLGDYERK